MTDAVLRHTPFSTATSASCISIPGGTLTSNDSYSVSDMDYQMRKGHYRMQDLLVCYRQKPRAPMLQVLLGKTPEDCNTGCAGCCDSSGRV